MIKFSENIVICCLGSSGFKGLFGSIGGSMGFIGGSMGFIGGSMGGFVSSNPHKALSCTFSI